MNWGTMPPIHLNGEPRGGIVAGWTEWGRSGLTDDRRIMRATENRTERSRSAVLCLVR